MSSNDNTRLEQRLAYEFSKPELLERALTHSSLVPEMRTQSGDGARPDGRKFDNERFEFLGDAVLELLASEYLVEKNVKAGPVIACPNKECDYERPAPPPPEPPATSAQTASS